MSHVVYTLVYNRAVRTMDLIEPYAKLIPIRHINFTTPENGRKRLLDKGKELYQEYLANLDWSKTLTFAGECLPQKADGTPDTEQEKSDVVHDLLAFLAEEMTRLNKEKQSRIKAFLAWLEKEILKGSVEDQRNKTMIKGFHNSTFEDLLDVLKKNKVVKDPCPANVRDTIWKGNQVMTSQLRVVPLPRTGLTDCTSLKPKVKKNTPPMPIDIYFS